MTPDVRALLGSEVTAAGSTRVIDLGGLAAACTPGAVVTVDALHEPNEDAAVVALGSDGTWVASVVDGNGTSAGTAAVVDHLVKCAPALMRAPRPNVVAALAGAMDALHAVRRAGAHATGASVTLVVGRGRRLWTWTRGDTAAILVTSTGLRTLGGVVPPPLPRAPVPSEVEGRRGSDDTVVLATDGLFEALGPGWTDVVAGTCGAPGRDARALTAAALDRIAGDAVTVVVVGP